MRGVACVLCFFKAIRQTGNNLTQCTDSVFHFERELLRKAVHCLQRGSKNVQQIYERQQCC